jgi:hypothetical protein
MKRMNMKTKKRFSLLVAVLFSLVVVLFFHAGCSSVYDDPVAKNDSKNNSNNNSKNDSNKVQLFGVSSVSVARNATSANVTFTGVTGLSLSASDFTVTGNAVIGDPWVSGDTVTVPLTFAANDTGALKTYVVSIAETSALIEGTAIVTVTHSTRVMLRASPSITEVGRIINAADVRFSGATGLSLSASDFRVTGNAEIGNPRVSGDYVTVPLTFTINETEAPRTFVVSIAGTSTLIEGSASVTVIQSGPYVETRKLLTAGPETVTLSVYVNVTFTGASKLSAHERLILSKNDFRVTGGSTIGLPYILSDGDTISVPVKLEGLAAAGYTFKVSVFSSYFYCPDTVTIKFQF